MRLHFALQKPCRCSTALYMHLRFWKRCCSISFERLVKSGDHFLPAVSCVTTLLLQRALCFDSWLCDPWRASVLETEITYMCVSVCTHLWVWMCSKLYVFVWLLNNRSVLPKQQPAEHWSLLKFNVCFLHTSLVDPLSYCGLWQPLNKSVESQLQIISGIKGDQRGLNCNCVWVIGLTLS